MATKNDYSYQLHCLIVLVHVHTSLLCGLVLCFCKQADTTLKYGWTRYESKGIQMHHHRLCLQMIMPRWVEPWRHIVVVVYVSMCYSFACFSAQLLKTRCWKLQYWHNTVFSWIPIDQIFDLERCSLDTTWYAHLDEQLLLIQSPVKSKLSTTNCLSPW